VARKVHDSFYEIYSQKQRGENALNHSAGNFISTECVQEMRNEIFSQKLLLEFFFAEDDY